MRKAVARALGQYRGEAAAGALLALARDPSYLVTEAALEALGKTRDSRAFDVLKAALDEPSWNDTIASGAARGLAELGDARSIPALIAASDTSRGDLLRAAAIGALGRAVHTSDSGRAVAIDRIVAALRDDAFSVRRAGISAAAQAEDPRALDALERILGARELARHHRSAAEAIDAIRNAERSGERIERLQGELDALRADYRALHGRLDAAEETR